MRRILTLVAYVEKNAISAAAMIMMGCPKIYMAEGEGDRGGGAVAGGALTVDAGERGAEV